MLGRIVRLFDRYAHQRLRLAAAGQDLVDTDGRVFGRIDRQVLRRNRLVVEGWTDATRIGVAINRTRAWAIPDMAQPGGAARGFVLDIPFEPGPIRVLAEVPGEAGPRVATLRGFSAGRVATGRARLWLPYLADMLRLTPHIWRWKWHGDPAALQTIKEGLHLCVVSDATELCADDILPPDAAAAPAPAPAPKAVTIVMPVFNAFDLLCAALARVARHTSGAGIAAWRLILVEDASTDPRVRPWLSDWAAQDHGGRVDLILNDANLGFVGAANLGLEHARDWPEDPVIILNSDAMVPAEWAARLVAPLADPGVASATPMSDNGEILTVPAICRPVSRPADGAFVDRMDVAARSLPARPVDLPTGVGFCMAMAPAFLAQLPAFDTAFGRGYGEETDWCQRARALGGRNVAVPNLFVEHRSGASFGSACKTRLLATNGALIARRYPGFDREVQGFIRADPLAAPRLALALSWAATVAGDAPVPVWLAHAMGGGAEIDLKRRIAADIDRQGAAVVLRVGLGHRWQVEVHSAGGAVRGLTNDGRMLRALLSRLPRRRILYSCGVGDPDPVSIPGLLLDLAGRPRAGGCPLPGGPQPVEMLLHDHLAISPAYTLLNSGGRYAGVPRPDTPAGADAAHRATGAQGREVPLAEWQAAWGGLVAAANRITVFSESSRAILTAAYPTVDRISLHPHAPVAAIPRIRADRGDDGRPVIAALGNIGHHKGAGVLSLLSRTLARRGSPARLVVIGALDPAFPLAPPAVVHGSYDPRDLPALVSRYGISGWFIPSIWPETFSFTTHEAIATGMPVFCFDLGAQAEALGRAIAAGAPGAVLPLGLSGADLAARILAGLQGGPHGAAGNRPTALPQRDPPGLSQTASAARLRLAADTG